MPSNDDSTAGDRRVEQIGGPELLPVDPDEQAGVKHVEHTTDEYGIERWYVVFGDKQEMVEFVTGLPDELYAVHSDRAANGRAWSPLRDVKRWLGWGDYTVEIRRREDYGRGPRR